MKGSYLDFWRFKRFFCVRAFGITRLVLFFLGHDHARESRAQIRERHTKPPAGPAVITRRKRKRKIWVLWIRPTEIYKPPTHILMSLMRKRYRTCWVSCPQRLVVFWRACVPYGASLWKPLLIGSNSHSIGKCMHNVDFVYVNDCPLDLHGRILLANMAIDGSLHLRCPYSKSRTAISWAWNVAGMQVQAARCVKFWCLI